MATRLDKGAVPASSRKRGGDKTPKPQSSAEQIGILHPERTRIIAGRAVEMREYYYIEGLHVQAIASTFIEELMAAMLNTSGTLPTDDEMKWLITRHIGVIHGIAAQAMTPFDDDMVAMANASTENARWIARLNDDDGEALLDLWWTATGPFFGKLLRRRMDAKKAQESLSQSVAYTTR